MRRKRTIYATEEVAQLWAHSWQSQWTGRNQQNTLFFEGDRIYSENHLIGKHLERNEEWVVLIAAEGNGTSAHIQMVRQATMDLRQFGVIDFNNYPKNLDAYESRILALEDETSKSRNKTQYNFGRLLKLVDEANEYASFFGLERKLQIHELEKLKERVRNSQMAMLSAKERTKRDEAQQLVDANSGKSAIPYWLFEDLKVIGDEVETASGGRYPIKDAQDGLAAFIKKLRENVIVTFQTDQNGSPKRAAS